MFFLSKERVSVSVGVQFLKIIRKKIEKDRVNKYLILIIIE